MHRQPCIVLQSVGHLVLCDIEMRRVQTTVLINISAAVGRGIEWPENSPIHPPRATQPSDGRLGDRGRPDDVSKSPG